LRNRVCGSAARRSRSAAVNRDLPMPGSPERSTTWPSPVFAFDHQRLEATLRNSGRSVTVRSAQLKQRGIASFSDPCSQQIPDGEASTRRWCVPETSNLLVTDQRPDMLSEFGLVHEARRLEVPKNDAFSWPPVPVAPGRIEQRDNGAVEFMLAIHKRRSFLSAERVFPRWVRERRDAKVRLKPTARGLRCSKSTRVGTLTTPSETYPIVCPKRLDECSQSIRADRKNLLSSCWLRT
jgi:hypothetical protein